jgi:hypothetical protein
MITEDQLPAGAGRAIGPGGSGRWCPRDSNRRPAARWTLGANPAHYQHRARRGHSRRPSYRQQDEGAGPLVFFRNGYGTFTVYVA